MIRTPNNFFIAFALLLLLSTYTAATASSKVKIACVGNSITEGNMSTNGAYPTYLQTLLGLGYQVENDGVSGTTMLKKGDKPYWKQGKLSQVFSFKPGIITIKLGTNDTKPVNWDTHSSDFKKDYLSMIDTFLTITPKPALFLVLPAPVFKESFNIRDSVIKKIIVIVKEVGAERGLPVIDANTPLLSFGNYFSDGVHPNAAGADSIAHIIYRAIKASTSTIPALPVISRTNNNGTPQSMLSGFASLPLSSSFDLSGRMVSIPAHTKRQIPAVRISGIDESKNSEVNEK